MRWLLAVLLALPLPLAGCGQSEPEGPPPAARERRSGLMSKKARERLAKPAAEEKSGAPAQPSSGPG